MSEPNLKKWAATEVAILEPTTNIRTVQNTNETSLTNDNDYHYNSTWFNNEYRRQIELLNSNPTIKSKIELYNNLPYSIRQFKRRLDRVAITDLTRSLQEKIDEILEARLVTEGYTAKNWPFIIFLLKNNHGYRDVKDVSNDTQVTFNVTRGAISSVTKRKQVKSKQQQG